MNNQGLTAEHLLNSWKEIAQYLRRSLRTVQRWEHLGMPVRRPLGCPRGPVIALTDELDGWLHSTPPALRDLRGSARQARVLRQQMAQLVCQITATTASIVNHLNQRG